MNWKMAITLCLLVSAAAAKCPNTSQPRDSKSLLHMEDLWLQSLVDRSSAELDCLLAPDFADSNWKGEHLNRAQVLEAAAKRDPVPAGAEHHFEDMSARIVNSGRAGGAAGDTGIVNGVSYWIYADGSKHSQARFTDVFVYRDHHWLAVAGHETAIATQ